MGSKDGSTFRLCIVHANKPGVLGEITTELGEKGLNITQQINTSRDDVAYTVIDTDTPPGDVDGFQAELGAKCEGIISTRFLGDPFADDAGTPGPYFWVRWAQ